MNTHSAHPKFRPIWGRSEIHPFPLRGDFESLLGDLEVMGFIINDHEEDQSLTVQPIVKESGTWVRIIVPGLLEHEEQGQDITSEQARDLLDVLARRVVPGHAVVLSEASHKGWSVARWAVDAQGARVSVALADLENLMVEQLDLRVLPEV